VQSGLGFLCILTFFFRMQAPPEPGDALTTADVANHIRFGTSPPRYKSPPAAVAGFPRLRVRPQKMPVKSL
jgi:hypothetical protein